jgi:hypothetical protein
VVHPIHHHWFSKTKEKNLMAETTTTILKPESLAKVLAVGSAPGVDSLHTPKSLYALYARHISVYEGIIEKNPPSFALFSTIFLRALEEDCKKHACFLLTAVFLFCSLACDLSHART